MTNADIIHILDKKYSGEGAVPCPNEGQKVKDNANRIRTDHGSMGVHVSGAFLVCGVCGANQPVARP